MTTLDKKYNTKSKHWQCTRTWCIWCIWCVFADKKIRYLAYVYICRRTIENFLLFHLPISTPSVVLIITNINMIHNNQIYIFSLDFFLGLLFCVHRLYSHWLTVDRAIYGFDNYMFFSFFKTFAIYIIKEYIH